MATGGVPSMMARLAATHTIMRSAAAPQSWRAVASSSIQMNLSSILKAELKEEKETYVKPAEIAQVKRGWKGEGEEGEGE